METDYELNLCNICIQSSCRKKNGLTAHKTRELSSVSVLARDFHVIRIRAPLVTETHVRLHNFI